MLRITPAPLNGSSDRTLRLDGDVTGPWVDELRRACARSLATEGGQARRLVLDLAGVSFLGPDGIELLRQLWTEGASITNASAFVTEQLRGIADVER
jgi:anti-anti-sigma regulatory factor